MLRQDSSTIDSDQNQQSRTIEAFPPGSQGIDIQEELNQLEERVLASPRIPLTRRTLVDEEQLLDQLDLVRLHLPAAFQEAQAIVQQKKEIILQAEQHAEKIFLEAKQHAEEIIQEAEAKAAQILNEMDIIQLAELEAKQIKEEAQQEREAVEEEIRAEIEQMQRLAIAEFETIQKGADEYADGVLKNMEQQLSGMLQIIRNGRQQLQLETPPKPKLPFSSKKPK